ncbi:hypothetical protein GCM10009645_22570 [Mycolicibacterium poriferae]|uniref:Transcriptional regulator WhiB n=1 Tax=Mycolicibacterium poriferae TaxID=39694 RepID=A0A6N4VJJ2_9MYCO|nr:WhiB family transcriptional regulator [Mycolicibacterium poriferae]MCV7266227.1 WhiB family transcriptional regulator [Mycolicibacterium poriferae]BBX54403.1 hypothetical protein MPOR_54290 [Mycolicibacterium poriferae]
MTDGWGWRRHARCRGLPTDLFYASEQYQGSLRRAREDEVKRICHRCAVRPQCLTHALEHPERHGIWGSTTPRERARMGSVGDLRPDAAVSGLRRPDAAG